MCLHVETFSRWSTKYSKWNTQTLVMDRIQLFQVQLTGWPIYNASVIHFWTNQWSVQSKEDCISAPQSVYPSTRRMSRAFWHDVFRYRTWLLKHKVRSKISQKKFSLCYYFDRSLVQQNLRIRKQAHLLTKVYTYCFWIWNSKPFKTDLTMFLFRC